MMKERGFILITTLLAITVVTLLVLGTMQQMLLCYKAVNAVKAQNKTLKQMELLLQQLPASNNCIRTEGTNNSAVQLVKRGAGCTVTFGKQEYRYLILDLQTNVHRRIITVMQVEKNQDLLQVVYLATKTKMGMRISSWRFLKYSVP